MSKIRNFLISEKAILFAIIVNSIALLLLSSFPKNSHFHNIFFMIDYGCVIFFILEAILKMSIGGPKAYFAKRWNIFDFIIVVSSIPVLIEPLSIVNTAPFAIVLLLRLGRLFRLFRALRFIPNREHLVDGIMRALKASIGIFIALIIINFIFAIGASMLFREASPEHFGNPALAIYSIFKVFTIEGWYEIPDAIALGSNDPVMGVLARIFFVITVIVGGIIGLSLANAVFVDEMTMDNTKELEEKVDLLLKEVQRLNAVMEAQTKTHPK